MKRLMMVRVPQKILAIDRHPETSEPLRAFASLPWRDGIMVLFLSATGGYIWDDKDHWRGAEITCTPLEWLFSLRDTAVWNCTDKQFPGLKYRTKKAIAKTQERLYVQGRLREGRELNELLQLTEGET